MVDIGDYGSNYGPTIVSMPAIAAEESSPFAHHHSSNVDERLQEEAEEVRESRRLEGCCPSCGTRLFKLEVKRNLLGRKIKTIQIPLTLPGVAERGQCLRCASNQSHQVDDLAAAIALSAMTEPELAEIPPAPTAGILPTGGDQSDAVYQGPFNDYGEPSGSGELVWPNGDRYVGMFSNGQRHGHGVLYFADGSEYVGNWKGGVMQGEGTRRFANGDVYQGQYEYGRRSGEGRLYFANGDLYHGQWKEDEIHGFGRYYFNNGQSLEAQFVNGERHGKSKLQHKDGKLDICRYEHNVRVGEGVRWSANRKKAWRIVNGKVKGRVSIPEAVSITSRCDMDGELYQDAVQFGTEEQYGAEAFGAEPMA